MIDRWLLVCSYWRLLMDGSIMGILYMMVCVLLFGRDVLCNLELEFSTEMGLQEQARLLYDCAGLALPGDLLSYVIVSVNQIVHDKLYIRTNEKTGQIGFGNALLWNGVCLFL